jgi:hypothetical protein
LFFFNLTWIVVEVNGISTDFEECSLTTKNFKKFFRGAKILGIDSLKQVSQATLSHHLGFRFFNNTERKGMWKMKESYTIQCRYDKKLASNPIQIIFDKVQSSSLAFFQ